MQKFTLKGRDHIEKYEEDLDKIGKIIVNYICSEMAKIL